MKRNALGLVLLSAPIGGAGTTWLTRGNGGGMARSRVEPKELDDGRLTPGASPRAHPESRGRKKRPVCDDRGRLTPKTCRTRFAKGWAFCGRFIAPDGKSGLSSPES